MSNVPNTIPESSFLSEKTGVLSSSSGLPLKKGYLLKRTLSLKYLFAGLLLVLAVVGVVAGIALSQVNQDVRQQASTGTTDGYPTNECLALCHGDPTCNAACGLRPNSTNGSGGNQTAAGGGVVPGAVVGAAAGISVAPGCPSGLRIVNTCVDPSNVPSAVTADVNHCLTACGSNTACQAKCGDVAGSPCSRSISGYEMRNGICVQSASDRDVNYQAAQESCERRCDSDSACKQRCSDRYSTNVGGTDSAPTTGTLTTAQVRYLSDHCTYGYDVTRGVCLPDPTYMDTDHNGTVSYSELKLGSGSGCQANAMCESGGCDPEDKRCLRAVGEGTSVYYVDVNNERQFRMTPGSPEEEQKLANRPYIAQQVILNTRDLALFDASKAVGEGGACSSNYNCQLGFSCKQETQTCVSDTERYVSLAQYGCELDVVCPVGYACKDKSCQKQFVQTISGTTVPVDSAAKALDKETLTSSLPDRLVVGLNNRQCYCKTAAGSNEVCDMAYCCGVPERPSISYNNNYCVDWRQSNDAVVVASYPKSIGDSCTAENALYCPDKTTCTNNKCLLDLDVECKKPEECSSGICQTGRCLSTKIDNPAKVTATANVSFGTRNCGGAPPGKCEVRLGLDQVCIDGLWDNIPSGVVCPTKDGIAQVVGLGTKDGAVKASTPCSSGDSNYELKNGVCVRKSSGPDRRLLSTCVIGIDVAADRCLPVVPTRDGDLYLGLGSKCSNSHQCASGICDDGTCLAIPAQRPVLNPDDECLSAEGCDCRGKQIEKNQRCQSNGTGTPIQTEYYRPAGEVILASRDAGLITDVTNTSGSCGNNNDCALGYFCSSEQCTKEVYNCRQDSQCASGNCTDGACEVRTSCSVLGTCSLTYNTSQYMRDLIHRRLCSHESKFFSSFCLEVQMTDENGRYLSDSARRAKNRGEKLYDVPKSKCGDLTIGGVGYSSVSIQPYSQNLGTCLHSSQNFSKGGNSLSGNTLATTENVSCEFMNQNFSLNAGYCQTLTHCVTPKLERYKKELADGEEDAGATTYHFDSTGDIQLEVDLSCSRGATEYSLHNVSNGCRAIDINVDSNYGNLRRNAEPVSNMPPEFVAAAEECGIVWGGRYNGANQVEEGCDPMEFAFAPACFGENS
jgi:hypothetical protein